MRRIEMLALVGIVVAGAACGTTSSSASAVDAGSTDGGSTDPCAAAESAAGTAIAAAPTGTCTADSDCVLVDLTVKCSSDFAYGCPVAMTRDAGADLQATLDRVGEQTCPATCTGFISPPCIPPGSPRCVDGGCGGGVP